MQIIIKNERENIPLLVDSNDSIAAVKANYLDSGKINPSRRDYVVLLYKGKELEDEKLLCEYGITENAVLIHIEPTHGPYRPVNYRVLAMALKKRRRHEEENLRMMKQENIWAADSTGHVHRMGFDNSIVSRCYPKKNTFSNYHPSIPHGRAFCNQVSVRIGGSSYHVLPSMEGRWNGEIESIPSGNHHSMNFSSEPSLGPSSATQVCSSELIFREEDQIWSQRQMRITSDGLTTTQHFYLRPVADGIIKVETSDDHSLRNCDITMSEIGLNIILLTATSKMTGKTVLVETTTLIDSTRRIRTSQRFDDSGAFRFVYVINEKRVVDAVSGAMERFDPAF